MVIGMVLEHLKILMHINTKVNGKKVAKMVKDNIILMNN
jgi:hypothetical protein